MCYNPRVVRDKPLGAPAYVKLVYLARGIGDHLVDIATRVKTGITWFERTVPVKHRTLLYAVRMPISKQNFILKQRLLMPSCEIIWKTKSKSPFPVF